jgi:hypothetical protein
MGEFDLEQGIDEGVSLAPVERPCRENQAIEIGFGIALAARASRTARPQPLRNAALESWIFVWSGSAKKCGTPARTSGTIVKVHYFT